MRKLGFPSPFCGSASIFSSSFQHLPFPRRGLRAWQAQGSEGWRAGARAGAWDPELRSRSTRLVSAELRAGPLQSTDPRGRALSVLVQRQESGHREGGASASGLEREA